jgi:hypothetical protein
MKVTTSSLKTKIFFRTFFRKGFINIPYLFSPFVLQIDRDNLVFGID